MSLFHTDKVGSDSGEVDCSIPCRTIGGAVLIRKADVEVTQFQSAFQSRIPSPTTLAFREQILDCLASLATVSLPEIRPWIRCSSTLALAEALAEERSSSRLNYRWPQFLPI